MIFASRKPLTDFAALASMFVATPPWSCGPSRPGAGRHRSAGRTHLPRRDRAGRSKSRSPPLHIAACPGTDTCKLGISSSRGLAAELRKRLGEKSFQWDDSVGKLHIKISGCFNSCGQHHVADLGFYGVSRKMSGYAVPHFQVVLGGEWEHNGASYGLPVIAIPSKNIPAVVSRLTDRYAANRKNGESFKDFVRRTGKVELKKMLEDLARPPADSSDRSFFQDWGDPREYTLADIGIGRMRRRSCVFRRVRSRRRRKGIVRGPGGARGRPNRAGGTDGLSVHAARRERRW